MGSSFRFMKPEHRILTLQGNEQATMAYISSFYDEPDYRELVTQEVMKFVPNAVICLSPEEAAAVRNRAQPIIMINRKYLHEQRIMQALRDVAQEAF